MASVIKMPQSGQNAAESLIVCWHVKEGDAVERGDVLFEIETDKATMNVESYARGTVLKILYGEGEKVAANEAVAYIGKPGEKLGEEEAPKAAAKAPAGKGSRQAAAIRMPQSGQNAAESLIVCWHVKEGDAVERGDVLFEIETDKATMNVESYAKGTVLKILYGEGEKVAANETVAYIGREGDALGDAPPKETSAASGIEDEYQPIMPERQVSAPAAAEQRSRKGGRVQASPKARAAARSQGKDIAALYEKLGRPVRYQDVAEFAPEVAPAAGEDLEYISEEPARMRKVIARRMLESTSNVPQFTVSISVDMTEMKALRAQINSILADRGVKVSFNDLMAKAVCIASQKTPYINAQYSESEIRIMKHVNVGIAVALDAGLVVPVIHGAEALSVREIAEKSSALIDEAKSGRLTADKMQGGTITISNLGMYGIDHFTAIINQPEAAILAVGGIVDTPVGMNGKIVLRPMMNITATFDHRIIDGGVGALFMAELKKIMEAPLGILL